MDANVLIWAKDLIYEIRKKWPSLIVKFGFDEPENIYVLEISDKTIFKSDDYKSFYVNAIRDFYLKFNKKHNILFINSEESTPITNPEYVSGNNHLEFTFLSFNDNENLSRMYSIPDKMYSSKCRIDYDKYSPYYYNNIFSDVLRVGIAINEVTMVGFVDQINVRNSNLINKTKFIAFGGPVEHSELNNFESHNEVIMYNHKGSSFVAKIANRPPVNYHISNVELPIYELNS